MLTPQPANSTFVRAALGLNAGLLVLHYYFIYVTSRSGVYPGVLEQFYRYFDLSGTAWLTGADVAGAVLNFFAGFWTMEHKTGSAPIHFIAVPFWLFALMATHFHIGFH